MCIFYCVRYVYMRGKRMYLCINFVYVEFYKLYIYFCASNFFAFILLGGPQLHLLSSLSLTPSVRDSIVRKRYPDLSLDATNFPQLSLDQLDHWISQSQIIVSDSVWSRLICGGGMEVMVIIFIYLCKLHS